MVLDEAWPACFNLMSPTQRGFSDMSSRIATPRGSDGMTAALRTLGQYVAWRVNLVRLQLLVVALAFVGVILIVPNPLFGGDGVRLLLFVVAGAIGIAAAALALDVDGSLHQADLFERLPVSRLAAWTREIAAGVTMLMLALAPGLLALILRAAAQDWFQGRASSLASAAMLTFAATAMARQLGLRPGVPTFAAATLVVGALVIVENVVPEAWMLSPGSRHRALLRVTEAATLVAAAAALATAAPRRPARRRAPLVRMGLVATCAGVLFVGLHVHAMSWLHSPWERISSAGTRGQSSKSRLVLYLETVPAGRLALAIPRVENTKPMLVPPEWAVLSQLPRGDGRLAMTRVRDDGRAWPTRRLEVALFDPASGRVEDRMRIRGLDSWSWRGVEVGEDPRDVVAIVWDTDHVRQAILLRDGHPVATRNFSEPMGADALPDGRFRFFGSHEHFLDPRTLLWTEVARPEHLVSAALDFSARLSEIPSRTPTGEACVDLLLAREGLPDALLLGAACVPGIEAGALLDENRERRIEVSWSERRAAFALERPDGFEVTLEVWNCDLDDAACSLVAGPEELPRRPVLRDWDSSRSIPEVQQLISNGRVAWSSDRGAFVSGPVSGATVRIADIENSLRGHATVGSDARCVAVGNGEARLTFWLDARAVPGGIENARAIAWLDEQRLIAVVDEQLFRVTVTPGGIALEPLP